MRDLGRSLKDQGFFEVDLSSGHVTWANDFVLDKFGYTLHQLQSMSVFDLVPEEMHEAVRNSIADQSHGKLFRFSIRPATSASGRLVWWYSVRVRAEHPLYWFRAEYLNTTDPKGPEYTSMVAAMNTANGFNELYNELADFKKWTSGSIERLDGMDADLQEDMQELKDQLQASVKASHRAANAALEARASIDSFKRDVSDQMSKQTAEIIRLISNDSAQAEALGRLEDFMKRATADAMNAMEKTTATAVQRISDETNKSGDKITKKVTVPIGLISAIVVIIQWLIQHYR